MSARYPLLILKLVRFVVFSRCRFYELTVVKRDRLQIDIMCSCKLEEFHKRTTESTEKEKLQPTSVFLCSTVVPPKDAS